MGRSAAMMIETAATTAEAEFTLDNIHITDADLPAFTDMPFEDIEELHLDHPGRTMKNTARDATTLRAFPRNSAKRV